MTPFPILTLKNALNLAREAPYLKPDADGTTHCDSHAFLVASVLGITKIWGNLKDSATNANMLVDYMEKHGEWFIKSADPVWAWEITNTGCLVFAAVKGAAHGHIAPVYPTAGMETSGNWNCQVPFVSNVGKRNAVMGANYAFPKNSPPSYYLVVV
jgi:hypothetical protein